MYYLRMESKYLTWAYEKGYVRARSIVAIVVLKILANINVIVATDYHHHHSGLYRLIIFAEHLAQRGITSIKLLKNDKKSG